jgi:hypothetical protein
MRCAGYAAEWRARLRVAVGGGEAGFGTLTADTDEMHGDGGLDAAAFDEGCEAAKRSMGLTGAAAAMMMQ